jgi:hypothetical protein
VRRLLACTAVVSLLAAGSSAHATQPKTSLGLLAGAGVVDATWHVGASAGQYASTVDPTDPMKAEWDPAVQHVKNAASYGIASRLSIRALVLQSPGEAPVALVKDDNYLSQDMLVRRAAQLLAADGSKVTYDHLLVSATHDHNSPYYSTPAAGVWLFQDAMDLRMFEYQARQMAKAVEIAERSLRPARVGATTVAFPDFQGNIAGATVSEDGSPAGYPLQDNDHGLTVLRVDDLTGRPIATYVNYAEHGESLDGYDLVSADWLSPFQRYVDRGTGAPVVFSQGAVGSAEGPYEHAYAKGKVPLARDAGEAVYKVYAHMGYAQAERGGHLLAERVLAAWKAIGAGQAQAPMTRNPVVKMVTHWVAGPVSHPYPSVSNCRTQQSVGGDPGAPVLGLPDCQRAGQGQPTSGLYDALRATGIPLPANYDASSFGSVEENLRLKLQAVRIGEVLLASCACEPQSDLIKALETRIDRVAGNRWDGFDYADPRAVAEGWPGLQVRPCFAGAGGQDCPDPRDATGVRRLKVTQAAFAHMEAQLHNPADGWNDTSAALTANSEPTALAAIKGNFTAKELLPSCGYAVPVGLGHTGDYNGYTVTYREYMARDSYRKALTSYGAHTADYMVTHLMALAANLRCGTPIPADATDAVTVVDEQRQATEAVALGQLSSYYYDGWSTQIPDSAGPAASVAQPRSVERFDAATFRWVGGDNWTDNPTVVVQKLDHGAWGFYGNQDGEVQTVLDQPAGIAAAAVDNRTGKQRWTWTASFEAFDAGPRADVRGGQTPSGSYRFVVDGSIHAGGKVSPYRVVSYPFTVSPWRGLTGKLSAVAGGVRFTAAPVVYPRTYRSPIRFVRDDLGGVDAGAKDSNPSVLCKTCTFRPWAARGQLETTLVSVLDTLGRVVRVVRGRGTSFTVALRPGEHAVVAAGALRDAFGETNGVAIRAGR